MKRTLVGWLVVATLVARALGQGTILWDEAVNGPLSNDAQFPTSLQPLTLGTNSLMGAVELTPHGANWGHDEDVFIITVPADMRVGMIGASADRSTSAWIGNPSFLTEYGFAIISSGGNLLPLWELTSLAPGTYGMVLVDSDFQPYPTAANYRLDFVVEAIPEPASVCLLLGGLGWLGIGIRARSKS